MEGERDRLPWGVLQALKLASSYFSSLLLLRSPALSLGLTIFGEIFAYMTVF